MSDFPRVLAAVKRSILRDTAQRGDLAIA